MSMIAEPTATHPAWCTRATCGAEGDVHWGEPFEHRPSPSSKSAEIAESTCEVQLSLAPDEDTKPLVWFESPGSGTMTIDDLAAFGAWLTERAGAFRQAIAIDSGDPLDRVTVLDAELGLEVETLDNAVLMMASTGSPDGSWYFGADEARALAAALIEHAARLDATEGETR